MRHFLQLCGAMALILCAASAAAADEPYPPCHEAPDPAYAVTGAPPNLLVLTEEGFVWDAPRCTGWGKGQYALLVAAAATFGHKGGVDGLIGKFAAISGFKTVRYWSTSHQAWRPLFRSAHALSTARQGARRGDFDLADLVPGPVKHFWLEENGPVGAAIFRLRVLERSRDRLIIDIRNQRAVNPPVHPKIAAGGYRYLFMFDRAAPGVWRYYGITGLRGKGAAAVTWFRNSYVNRAIAMYRYVAGIPMEREPPAAR